MKAHTILKDVFRVIAAGPWDPSDFGPVEVELTATKADAFFPPRLIVRLQEKGRPPVTFDAEGYHFEASVLRIWTGGRQFRWVFKSLD